MAWGLVSVTQCSGAMKRREERLFTRLEAHVAMTLHSPLDATSRTQEIARSLLLNYACT
jgi:hypothetical protein